MAAVVARRGGRLSERFLNKFGRHSACGLYRFAFYCSS